MFYFLLECGLSVRAGKHAGAAEPLPAGRPDLYVHGESRRAAAAGALPRSHSAAHALRGDRRRDLRQVARLLMLCMHANEMLSSLESLRGIPRHRSCCDWAMALL